MLVNLGTCYRSLCGLMAMSLLLCVSVSADAQEIRNYNANKTTNTIVADGVISPGEWDGADPAAGDWRELRMPFSDVDEDNNRFQILWDDTNLYILYETDYDFGWLSNLGGTRPGIVFGEENLNLYIDPNNDGDLNTAPDGTPLAPGASNGGATDGYQFAFNQYEGTSVSADGDFQGVGFFTEAHVNSPFGDAANWRDGEGNDGGMIGSGIVVGQTNTNGANAGGIAEIVIPFADLDADAIIPRDVPAESPVDIDADGDIDGTDYLLAQQDGTDPAAAVAAWQGLYPRPDELETGLNATAGVTAGDIWGFNMSQISRDSANNFLPIWNHHDNNSFAPWPHGTLTFVEAPAVSAIPEPGCGVLAIGAALLSFARRRR